MSTFAPATKPLVPITARRLEAKGGMVRTADEDRQLVCLCAAAETPERRQAIAEEMVRRWNLHVEEP